jgi:hypothetical protein
MALIAITTAASPLLHRPLVFLNEVKDPVGQRQPRRAGSFAALRMTSRPEFISQFHASHRTACF